MIATLNLTVVNVKESGVGKTKSDVAAEVAYDSRIGVDGSTNFDRVNYVAQVFETEFIDLDMKFDFSAIRNCPDPEMVMASKHLAILQLSYWNGLLDAGLVMTDNHLMATSQLVLDINKITWHYDHMIKGAVTPPYQFIH